MINALRNVGSGLNLIQQTLTSHKEKVKVVSALLAVVCADFYMISIVYLFMSIYRSVLSLSNLGSLIYSKCTGRYTCLCGIITFMLIKLNQEGLGI